MLNSIVNFVIEAHNAVWFPFVPMKFQLEIGVAIGGFLVFLGIVLSFCTVFPNLSLDARLHDENTLGAGLVLILAATVAYMLGIWFVVISMVLLFWKFKYQFV